MDGDEEGSKSRRLNNNRFRALHQLFTANWLRCCSLRPLPPSNVAATKTGFTYRNLGNVQNSHSETSSMRTSRCVEDKSNLLPAMTIGISCGLAVVVVDWWAMERNLDPKNRKRIC